MNGPDQGPGRPPSHPSGADIGLDRYLTAWAGLHGGVDPRANRLVLAWLTVAHRCAAPLARAGVRPAALTVTGLMLTVVALVPARAGGRWALAAAGLCALSGLMDSLDGAVAVLSRRTSAWGAVLDALADRCADVVCVVVLVLLWRAEDLDRWRDGVPVLALVLAGVAGGSSALHEYVRARAAAARMDGLRVLTVGERPTRIIGVVMFAVAAGVTPTLATGWSAVGLGFLAVTGTVGLVQLLVVLHRLDPGPGTGDPVGSEKRGRGHGGPDQAGPDQAGPDQGDHPAR